MMGWASLYVVAPVPFAWIIFASCGALAGMVLGQHVAKRFFVTTGKVLLFVALLCALAPIGIACVSAEKWIGALVFALVVLAAGLLVVHALASGWRVGFQATVGCHGKRVFRFGVGLAIALVLTTLTMFVWPYAGIGMMCATAGTLVVSWLAWARRGPATVATLLVSATLGLPFVPRHVLGEQLSLLISSIVGVSTILLLGVGGWSDRLANPPAPPTSLTNKSQPMTP